MTEWILDALPSLWLFGGYESVDSPERFGLWLAGATFAELLLVGWILRRRRSSFGTPAVLGLDRVLVASFAAALSLPLRILVIVPFGLRSFGMMALAWYELVVVVPLCGVWVLCRPRRSTTRGVRCVALASLLLWPVAIYSSWIEPFRLQVEEVVVPVQAPSWQGDELRIGVLADLQTDRIGAYEQAAVDRLLALEPDVILVPGDLFQGSEAALSCFGPELTELLGRLRAPGGVYFVPGDVDDSRQTLDVLEAAGIEVLHHETAQLEVRGKSVLLGGISTWRGPVQSVIARLSAEHECDLRILMAHHGRHVDRLHPEDDAIDLVVAGHTHGGQVRVPFLGPLITLSPLPRSIAAGGLHERNGHLLYVSRGVGLERWQAPRIRFLCPPEVTLLRLRARSGDVTGERAMDTVVDVRSHHARVR